MEHPFCVQNNINVTCDQRDPGFNYFCVWKSVFVKYITACQNQLCSYFMWSFTCQIPLKTETAWLILFLFSFYIRPYCIYPLHDFLFVQCWIRSISNICPFLPVIILSALLLNICSFPCKYVVVGFIHHRHSYICSK